MQYVTCRDTDDIGEKSAQIFRRKILSSIAIHLYGGPRVVVSTATFHARARGSFPCLGGLKETMFIPHSVVKLSIVESLHDREVVCSPSDH